MRQLAAIMFTDMVGFTALMQEDEHRAMSIRDRHRDTLREMIEERGGEIVQFYGDGTLSVFGSAVDGVSAAVAAQQALQQDPAIPVRIGLHIGDTNRDEDGIYGDGVNMATRIEGLSVPGAVLISHPKGGITPLAYALAVTGRTTEAEALLTLTEEREREEPDLALDLDFATVYSALGRSEEALDRLRRAAEKRLGTLIFLRHWPSWRRLRQIDGVEELMEEFGL